MKKIVSVLLIMLICFAITSCGLLDDTSNSPSENTDERTEDIKTDSKKEEATSQPKNDVAWEITYSSAKSYKNSIGTVWAQGIVEITNTGNIPLYLGSGSFDFEDMDGKLIKNRSMVSVFPTVIEPGEKAYYYEELTLDIDDPIELKVIARPDIKKAKVDVVRFPVTDFEVFEGKYSDLRIKGRVENTSDEKQGMTYIAAILIDNEGLPIGLIFTIITDDLLPGDKAGFEGSALSFPDEITVESVASYVVFAYPLQYQF